MGFWKNVEERREYLGITRKELAQAAGIKYAIIGAGLEKDSIPAANTALRIAKVLSTPLENLLDDDFSKYNKFNYDEITELINKYNDILENLEKIPPKIRQPIIDMIKNIASTSKK